MQRKINVTLKDVHEDISNAVKKHNIAMQQNTAIPNYDKFIDRIKESHSYAIYGTTIREIKEGKGIVARLFPDEQRIRIVYEDHHFIDKILYDHINKENKPKERDPISEEERKKRIEAYWSQFHKTISSRPKDELEHLDDEAYYQLNKIII